MWFDVLRFIKRCDALNFQFFINCFFEHSGYCKNLKPFFLIFWRLKILDLFKYLLRGINIQWIVAFFLFTGINWLFCITVDDIQDYYNAADLWSILDSIYKLCKTAAEFSSLDFSNLTPKNLTLPKSHLILCTFISFHQIAFSVHSSNKSSFN